MAASDDGRRTAQWRREAPAPGFDSNCKNKNNRRAFACVFFIEISLLLQYSDLNVRISVQSLLCSPFRQFGFPGTIKACVVPSSITRTIQIVTGIF